MAGAGLSVSGVLLAAALPFLGVTLALPQGVPTGQLLALVLCLGLRPTALAPILFCNGMATFRSTAVGLIASLTEPAIAAFLAFVILHEVRAPYEILVLLIITVAMVVLVWSDRLG